MAQKLSKTTTDHETIRRWAEERGGKPAEVASTAREGDVGIIRIDFPGFGGEGKLQEISWDDWFKKFDDMGLALVYQDETSGGERSNFNKLIARETAEARAQGKRTSRRSAGRSGATATRTRRSSGRNGATAARKSSGRGAQGGRRTAGRAMAAKTAGRSGSRSGGTSRSGSRSASRSRSGSKSRSGARSGGSRSGSRGGSRSGRRSR